MSDTLRRIWRFLVRVARMGRTLMTSRSLPLWLRGMYAVILLVTQFALGPLDDVLLLLPVGITWLFYRPVLVSAWAASAGCPNTGKLACIEITCGLHWLDATSPYVGERA